MNPQLSWLIPITGGIYLSSIYVFLFLGQQNRWQNFVSDCWEAIEELRR
jgi:hypothetical protein